MWGICFYLCGAFFLFSFICYSAWMRSDFFNVVGWSWENKGAVTFQRVMYSFCGGGLGAVSYGFWKLFKYYCGKGKFNPKWTVWYIFGMASGSLLGIATYAVVMGGFLLLGENISLRSSWAIFALSFLTGFSGKRVLRMLHALAGVIFKEA